MTNNLLYIISGDSTTYHGKVEFQS